MAVTLGRKNVKDTTEFESYAIGLSLPLSITNTAFAQTFTTTEQVKTNIRNLLLTQRGERIMQPEFGSGLREILFEFNNEDVSAQIQTTIETTLQKWLPYVSVESIEIEQTDSLKDNNRVNVSIDFRIGDNVQLETVTFGV